MRPQYHAGVADVIAHDDLILSPQSALPTSGGGRCLLHQQVQRKGKGAATEDALAIDVRLNLQLMTSALTKCQTMSKFSFSFDIFIQ